MSGLLDWLIQRSDNILTLRELAVFVSPTVEVFPKGQAGNSHVVTVNAIVLEQVSQDLYHLREYERASVRVPGQTWDATDLVYVFHDILAARLKIGDEGGALGDVLEVVDSESDANRVGYGNQVQDGICRSTKDHSQDLKIVSVVLREYH
jgi:hypothetical protein